MFRRTLPHRRPFWQSALRGLLLFLCMAAPLAPAQALQEFTILATGDATSESQAEAIALDYARKRAVYLAVRKLGFGNAGEVVMRIPAKDMPQIIRGATILQTKRTGTKTYAQVSVSIEDAVLRKTLNVKDVPSDDAPAKPTTAPRRNVLVLPVLVQPDTSVVWGKDNALRGPLGIELMRQSHGTVILPGGDLQDLRLVDAENIMSVTPAEMKPMFARYGADEIVIAIAKLGAEGSEDPSQVILRRLSTIPLSNETFEVRPEGASDTAADRLAQVARAIAGTANEIASSTAVSERARLEKAKRVSVHLTYAIPKELAAMQTAIRGAPGVLLLELPSIALNDVTGTLYIDGEVAPIRAYLSKQGIIVRETSKGWTISTR